LILSIHFSYRWSGTIDYTTTNITSTTSTATTTTTTTTNNNNNNNTNPKSARRGHEMKETGESYELVQSTRQMSPTADFMQQRIDQKPLLDTSTESFEV